VDGTVTEFDEARGLGTITVSDGAIYAFHCTQIADGTRTIDVGQAVRFELLPKLGRYEATSIEKVP
jgi:cold shock CspA family protein